MCVCSDVANVRPVLNMPGASASSSISNLPGLHALPSGSMSALQSLMAATGGTGIPGLSAPGFPNAAAAGVMDHGSSPVILVSNLNEDVSLPTLTKVCLLVSAQVMFLPFFPIS